MTSSQSAAIETFTPVLKVVTVKAPPDRAFRRFTREIGVWWPIRSHSVGGLDAETVAFEERVGGRIVEKMRGGRESVWGTVNVWDPPRRLAFSWHPGDEPSKSTSVEVRFTAIDGGRTRVELEHSGFERLGAMARRARRGYPIGWAYVLGLYAEKRGPFMLAVSGLSALMIKIRRRRAAA
jgi:uncharacterized protein YndB with AHSA1/START domain